MIVHSDQGSQFSSYEKLLPPWLRAFPLLKRERIRRKIYANWEDVRRGVFDYIELLYNPKRWHGYTLTGFLR